MRERSIVIATPLVVGNRSVAVALAFERPLSVSRHLWRSAGAVRRLTEGVGRNTPGVRGSLSSGHLGFSNFVWLKAKTPPRPKRLRRR